MINLQNFFPRTRFIPMIFLIGFSLVIGASFAWAQAEDISVQSNTPTNVENTEENNSPEKTEENSKNIFYQAVPENKNIPKYMRLSSMMFTQKEMNYVEQALYAHNNSIPIEMVLPEIFPPQRAQAATTKTAPKDNFSNSTVEEVKQALNLQDLPNFFLSSIMYFSPDSWTIWLDGKKITPSKMPENIMIERVEEGVVQIRWIFKEFAELLPMMIDKCVEKNAVEVICSDDENYVVVNKPGQFATFNLSPNQTFVGYLMKIQEGDSKKQREAEAHAISDAADAALNEINAAGAADVKNELVSPRKKSKFYDLPLDKILNLKDNLTH